jgi:hypothetical protein
MRTPFSKHSRVHGYERLPFTGVLIALAVFAYETNYANQFTLQGCSNFWRILLLGQDGVHSPILPKLDHARIKRHSLEAGRHRLFSAVYTRRSCHPASSPAETYSYAALLVMENRILGLASDPTVN